MRLFSNMGCSSSKKFIVDIPSHVEHKIERNESDVPMVFFGGAINILPKGQPLVREILNFIGKIFLKSCMKF